MPGFQNDDEPRKKASFVIGGDLDQVSVGEIDERIAELEAEIRRLHAARGKKLEGRNAAESLFKM